MKYEFTLVNEKLVLYNRISWLIIFLHLVVYIFLAFFSTVPDYRSNASVGLVLFGIIFLAMYFFKPIKKKGSDLLFLVIGIVWINMQLYWLAIIPAVFYILNGASTSQKIVTFTDENILYPSVPVKKLEWGALNNVVLKDGLLTIDQKNNRIIQQRILEHSSAVEEIEFNEFCKKKLKEHEGPKGPQ